MTCQNCGHTPAAHMWKDDPERSDCGQPCDCTAYREPEPADITPHICNAGHTGDCTRPDHPVPAVTDLPDAVVEVPSNLIDALQEAVNRRNERHGTDPLIEIANKAEAVVDAVAPPEPLPMCKCWHWPHPDGPCPAWNSGPHWWSRKRYCLCRIYQPVEGDA